MIENKEPVDPDADREISPFVKSLRTGVEIPADYDYEREYVEYLSKKYI